MKITVTRTILSWRTLWNIGYLQHLIHSRHLSKHDKSTRSNTIFCATPYFFCSFFNFSSNRTYNDFLRPFNEGIGQELDRWHFVPYARWKSTYRKRCQTITSRVRKPASLAPFGHISDAKDFASSFWFFLIRDNGGIFNFNFFFFKTSFFLKWQ